MSTQSRQPLCWCLASLLSRYSACGNSYCMKDFRKSFLRVVQCVDDCQDGVVLRTLATWADHAANICTTRCMITMLWQIISGTKSPDIRTACLNALKYSASRVIVELPDDMLSITVIVQDRTWPLRVASSGHTHGFWAWLLQTVNHNWTNSVGESWANVRDAGLVHGNLCGTSHATANVICFTSYLLAWRSRCHQKSISDVFHRWRSAIRKGTQA